MSKRGNAVTSEGDAHETSVAQTQWDIDGDECWAKQNRCFVNHVNAKVCEIGA